MPKFLLKSLYTFEKSIFLLKKNNFIVKSEFSKKERIQSMEKIVKNETIKREACGEHWFTEYRTGRAAAFSLKVVRHLHTVEGDLQRVDVFDTKEFGRVLTLDGLIMVTERDEYMYHEMLVHVPMFSHPCPKRVLIIGGGDGGSLREVLKHPTVEEVVLVEIDSNVISASKEFLPFCSSGMNDPRSKITIGEGGLYVKEHPDSFDVIIIDSTDPTKGAGGLLFTEEFYNNCRKALKSGGTMSAETENFFYDENHWEMAFKRISNVFNVAVPYWGLMTSYPSGWWTYTLAGENLDPRKDFRKTDAEKMSANLKYYNPDIHMASFALPNNMKKKVEEIKNSLNKKRK